MTEREMFEDWFKGEHGVDDPDFVKDYAWKVWQAATQLEGYKFVPVELTNKMAYAAKNIDGRLSAFKYGDVYKAMIGEVDDH